MIETATVPRAVRPWYAQKSADDDVKLLAAELEKAKATIEMLRAEANDAKEKYKHLVQSLHATVHIAHE